MSNYKIALLAVISFCTFVYIFTSMTESEKKVKPLNALLTLALDGVMIWLAVMA